MGFIERLKELVAHIAIKYYIYRRSGLEVIKEVDGEQLDPQPQDERGR